jgi:capsular exopolysaccharide synthesis family protein
MGKVYDALRKAEEQRTRRLHEAADVALPAAAPEPARAPEPVAEPPRPEPPRAAQPRLEPPRAAFPGLRDRAAAPAEGGDAHNKRRIVVLQPESAIAEQFRSLRARIDALAVHRALRTIAVTSALPEEGKTMAAISLAVVSAMQLGSRVALVECDLREPTIAAALGLRLDAGLGELLTGAASLEQATQRAPGTALDVLAVRALPLNPSELLASEAFRRLLEQLAERYDRVILDLPPTLGLPDAKTVSGLCDGTVFVVHADTTSQHDAESALEVLGRERVLGLVMNGAETALDSYAKYLRS